MENQQQEEYQEIDLHSTISTFIKKLRLILGITFFFAVAALVVSFILPKVYRVASSLEVGFIIDSEKPGIIENPIQLKEKIDKDIYGQRIREQLKISQKDYPKIKVENMKGTNVLSLSTDSSKPDQAKQVLETINNLITTQHGKEVELMKKDVESKIEIEKKDIERLQNKIQSLDREKNILENKIIALQAIPIVERNAGTQFVLFDNKEKLEEKKQEIENLYQAINSSQNTINSLETKIQQSRLTTVIKDPAISERPVGPRPLLNTFLGVLLGFFVGTFLAFSIEWWKKNA